MRLLVQRKLAGIVQHHELLQQCLDDFPGGGVGADVQLLHAVRRQVEGRSLLVGGPLTLGRDPAAAARQLVATFQGRNVHGGDSDRSAEPQADSDEAGEGAIGCLRYAEEQRQTSAG